MPDAEAEHTANEILKLVTATDDRDLVIALVSGGGSALLPVPSNGIVLSEKKKVSCYAMKYQLSNSLRSKFFWV